MAVCAVCGSSPCYGICPTQDPFHGDHAAEEAAFESGRDSEQRIEAERDAVIEAWHSFQEDIQWTAAHSQR